MKSHEIAAKLDALKTENIQWCKAPSTERAVYEFANQAWVQVEDVEALCNQTAGGRPVVMIKVKDVRALLARAQEITR